MIKQIINGDTLSFTMYEERRSKLISIKQIKECIKALEVLGNSREYMTVRIDIELHTLEPSDLGMNEDEFILFRDKHMRDYRGLIPVEIQDNSNIYVMIEGRKVRINIDDSYTNTENKYVFYFKRGIRKVVIDLL